MVNHRHLIVNGRRVDIPSVTLKVGDVITVNDKAKRALSLRRLSQNRSIPAWLQFNEERFEATLISLPIQSDSDYDVTESAVVELYSK